MEHDVLTLGYYGFGNIGDESILSALIKDLKELMPGINICVLSYKPEETSKIYNVRAIDRFNLFEARRAVKNSKMLIAGGGSLLQDGTSSKSLWYYLYIIHYALRCGLKTMIYANGVGPINGKFNAAITTKIIKKVQIITLRDLESANKLKKMHINRDDVVVTADPAVGTPSAPDEAINKILSGASIPNDSRFAAIAMCNKGFAEKELEQIIAKICDYLNNEIKMAPAFICMQHSADIKVAKRIVNKMDSQARIITQELTNPEMLGVISKAGLVVGDRLHALIFAAISGAPFTGIAYDPKINAFMDRVGNKNYVASQGLTFNGLKAQINSCLGGQDADRDKCQKSVAEMIIQSKRNARLAIDLLNGKKTAKERLK